MIQLHSYKLLDWPLKDYKFVSDLIDFEGPILVHYMNQERHAFYYWVEGDTNFNRWLCFELSLFELYDYLVRNVSLYELIENKQSESFFITDIDKELKYDNFQMLTGYAIPEEYLPDTDSYYLDEPSEFYDELFKKLTIDGYTEALRRRSIGLEIKPYKDSEHGDTVSVSDTVDFLSGVNTSYKHFVAHEFFMKYKDQYTDAKKLVKATNKIVAAAEMRVADAVQHSFQISVATDRIMDLDVKKEYNDFSENIINQYYDEVLNIDLNNETVIGKLIEKYDDETRNNIFRPLIKIINNTNCNLSIINKKENKRRQIPKVNQVLKSQILKKSKNETPAEDLKKVFYTITLELNANTDLTTISKKDIQEGTLFATVSDTAQHEIPKFDFETFTVIFKKPILLNYTTDNDGNFIISFEPLKIVIKDSVRNNAFERTMDAFEDLLKKDYLAKTPQNKDNKLFFDRHIDDIIFKEGN